MRYAVVGSFLILYSMFFTPCFWEPSDLVVSTGYITAVYTLYPDWAPVILPLWIASGYLALIWGIIFLGRSFTKYIPWLRPYHKYLKKVMSHPVMFTATILLVAIFATLLITNQVVIK